MKKIFFCSVSKSLESSRIDHWVYPWYEWQYTPHRCNFQITRNHIILSYKNQVQAKIGRYHNMLQLHQPQNNRLPEAYASATWFYNPREEVFLIGNKTKLSFFYMPTVLNFEERSNFNKQYLMLKNNSVVFKANPE